MCSLTHSFTSQLFNPAPPWRQVSHWFEETKVNQRAVLAYWHFQAVEGGDTEYPAQVTIL